MPWLWNASAAGYALLQHPLDVLPIIRPPASPWPRSLAGNFVLALQLASWR